MAFQAAENIANIKDFDCNALQVKKRLGQGSFGDVHTTEYETEENVKTVVAEKMLARREVGLRFRPVGLRLRPQGLRSSVFVFDTSHHTWRVRNRRYTSWSDSTARARTGIM